MDERKDVLFGKSVFGGFRRGDVIRYIDTLQRQHMRTAQDEARQLAEAREQVRDLTRQLAAARAQIDEMQAQIDAHEAPQTQGADEQSLPQQTAQQTAPPPAPAAQNTQAPQTAAETVFVETAGSTQKKPSPLSRKGRGPRRFF